MEGPGEKQNSMFPLKAIYWVFIVYRTWLNNSRKVLEAN